MSHLDEDDEWGIDNWGIDHRMPPRPEPVPDHHTPTHNEPDMREQVSGTIADWIQDSVPDPGASGLQYWQAADAVARQVQHMLEEERRRAAMLMLAEGRSLAEASREMGLSRWALSKRWPDLWQQSRPWRWLCLNEIPMHRAMCELVEHADDTLNDERSLHLAYVAEYRQGYRPDLWWSLAHILEDIEPLLEEPSPTSPDFLAARNVMRSLLSDWQDVSEGHKKPDRMDEHVLAEIRRATKGTTNQL